MIATIHIECLCDKGRLPNAKNDADKISLMCITFHQFENGQYNHISSTTLSLDHFSEKDIILQFIKIIKDKKVTLLLGWNIFGFDYIYLQDRAEKLGIKELAELGLVDKGQKQFYLKSNINKFDIYYYFNNKHIFGNLFKILKRYNMKIPQYDDNNIPQFALDCCLSYFALYQQIKN